LDKNKVTTVIQITDTHLFKSDTHEMFGVNTNKNFYSVMDYLHEQKEITPDLFLLTGDLSQDESEESYIKIVEKMNEFGKKIYWVPGNHDNIEVMKKIFSTSPLFLPVKNINLNTWGFILLNTKMNGSDKGFLSENELRYLEESLNNFNDQKSIGVIMHHHPVTVNTPLIDQYILTNSSHFWNIVNRHSNVKLIMCGHVHGDYSIKHNNIVVECSPSTCLQWEKGTIELKIVKSIGFKVYRFVNNTYAQFVKLWS